MATVNTVFKADGTPGLFDRVNAEMGDQLAKIIACEVVRSLSPEIINELVENCRAEYEADIRKTILEPRRNQNDQ